VYTGIPSVVNNNNNNNTSCLVIVIVINININSSNGRGCISAVKRTGRRTDLEY